MTGPVPAARIVEAAAEALMRSYVVPDSFTATKDARIVLAVVLPMVADRASDALSRIYDEHGHNDDWGVRVIYLDALTREVQGWLRSLAEGLGDE